MSVQKKRAFSLSAALITLALVSACSSPVTEPNGEAPEGNGATDVDFCAAPLNDEPVSISFSGPIEGFAPLLLAVESGAFEAAGIDLSLERVPAADSLAQMGQGRLDGQWSSYSASHMNAVGAGIEMIWVAPSYEMPSMTVTQQMPGFWANVKYVGTGPEPDLSGLVGQTVGTPTRGTAVDGWVLAQALEAQGLSYGDVAYAQMSGADSLAALENDAVAAAWLSGPLDQQAYDNPNLRLIATYNTGLNGSGLIVGPSFLEKPEVLTKFLQVIAETSAKYLQGDYHNDDEVVDMLSNAIGQEPTMIKASVPLIFDATLDLSNGAAYINGLQEFTRTNVGLDYADNLSASSFFDASFARDAASCLD